MRWAQMEHLGDHSVIGMEDAEEWKSRVEAKHPTWKCKLYPRPVKIAGRKVDVVVIVTRTVGESAPSKRTRPMVWVNDDGTLNGQEHSGRPIEDVVRDAPDYLRWILSLEDLQDDDREVIDLYLGRGA